MQCHRSITAPKSGVGVYLTIVALAREVCVLTHDTASVIDSVYFTPCRVSFGVSWRLSETERNRNYKGVSIMATTIKLEGRGPFRVRQGRCSSSARCQQDSGHHLRRRRRARLRDLARCARPPWPCVTPTPCSPSPSTATPRWPSSRTCRRTRSSASSSTLTFLEDQGRRRRSTSRCRSR